MVNNIFDIVFGYAFSRRDCHQLLAMVFILFDIFSGHYYPTKTRAQVL